MSALAALQRDFAATVLDEARPTAWSTAGMATYRRNYRAQLLACMEDSFPVLRLWLGEEAFVAHAIAYALACPPHSWSLDHFPARFTAWLEGQAADAVLVDLARIEWALAECFVAPDQPVLTIAAIATTDWDSARLAPIGASRLVPLASNAAAIWLAAQEGAAMPPAQVPAAKTRLLVWRRHEQCHLRELDPIEAAALESLPAGFADLCASLCDQLGDEQGIAHAGGLLAQWAEAGAMAATA